LDDVHGTVRVPGQEASGWKRLFAFLGPAYMVSVGYMDPGNWATDLEGGARFGYALAWVLLMSNAMAVLLQSLAARLGVVTGHDLAQACRAEYSRPVNWALWLLAEVAIAATDLAEVLGTIIALKLLFQLPLLWGCLITALDTLLLLWLQRLGIRKLEAFILALVATMGACFLIQIFWARPDLGQVARGFWPTLPRDAEGSSLFVAIGILGATVMPHNLYLHSALVQSRRIGSDDDSKRRACRYNLIDSAVALNAAFFVNLAILVLAGTTFYSAGEPVDSIERAHELLPRFLGPLAPWLFGIALLCAGQSSTLTGTLAGQIVMEGFLQIRLRPWLRRLLTRLIALLPAVVVIATVGETATQQLLVLSQVILSLQLSFAVIPLIHFTSNPRNMGALTPPRWAQALAWLSAGIIVGLNGWLVLDETRAWTSSLLAGAGQGGASPVLAGLALIGLALLLGGAAVLLIWVLIKPWVRPSVAWSRTARAVASIDWADALQPRPLASIAVALEHNAADTEILNRALALARPGQTRLILLHVADSPVTGLLGADAADRHTDSDDHYLDEVARGLAQRGYRAEPVLLRGPDPAAEIVNRLRRQPVDLLVVGSHGHGALSDLLFGQTVDRVRHGLEIPMLITRPQPSPASDA
jgi:manganese transport protein